MPVGPPRGSRGSEVRGWLAAQVTAMAPRLRVRDQAALRRRFPGRSADQIADALIDRAARASAAAGGAAGVSAALPALPAFPVEVAAETLVVVGIEIKLIAELHEAFGAPAPGKTPERMSAYVAAWAHRSGVFMIPGGLALAAGSPLARTAAWRPDRPGRGGSLLVSLAPLLTGAAIGAFLNSAPRTQAARPAPTSGKPPPSTSHRSTSADLASSTSTADSPVSPEYVSTFPPCSNRNANVSMGWATWPTVTVNGPISQRPGSSVAEIKGARHVRVVVRPADPCRGISRAVDRNSQDALWRVGPRDPERAHVDEVISVQVAQRHGIDLGQARVPLQRAQCSAAHVHDQPESSASSR